MKIGKRERIVIGVIGAVAAIAVLHFQAFKESAAQLRQAKSEYDQALSVYTSGGSPQAMPNIHEFDYQTINKEIEFYELARQGGVYEPDILRGVATTVEEAAELEEGHRNRTWEKLHELQDLRKNLKTTQLTFMDEYEDQRIVQGLNRATEAQFEAQNNPNSPPAIQSLKNYNKRWAILDELPPTITQSGKDVGDLLRDLNDTNALIESAPPDSPLLARKEFEYNQQLTMFGLAPARRADMKEKLGTWVAHIMTLNRIDLVKDSVPRQELGILSDSAYEKQLKRLFRLEWEEDFYGFPYRQMNTLLLLIRIADKHGISAVTEVKFWDVAKLKWPPKEEREVEEPVAAKGGLNYDESMMYEEEMMMQMMMGGGGMEESRDMGMAGMGMGMSMQEPEPEEDEFYIGDALAVEIEMLGSNSSVMAFLYEVTNSDEMLEVDSVNIAAVPTEEDQVRARFVVRFIYGLKKFSIVESDLNAKVESLVAQKHRVAQEEGAKELAAEEGFVPDPAQAAAVAWYNEAGAVSAPTDAEGDPAENMDEMMGAF